MRPPALGKLDNLVYGFDNHVDYFTGGTMFAQHTLESAPVGSRPLMEKTVAHVGHLPDPVARLAESPEMLGGFLQASNLFEHSTLDPLAREVVVMVIAARNDCRVCLAMHTGRLRGLGADVALITGLRAQTRCGPSPCGCWRRPGRCPTMN
jgi:AhpD family alkylhydroperoxidase